jgi:hypothetical protein
VAESSLGKAPVGGCFLLHHHVPPAEPPHLGLLGGGRRRLPAHQTTDRSPSSPRRYGARDDDGDGPGGPGGHGPPPGEGARSTLQADGAPQPTRTASVLTVRPRVLPPRPGSYPLVGGVTPVAWTLRAVRYGCGTDESARARWRGWSTLTTMRPETVVTSRTAVGRSVVFLSPPVTGVPVVSTWWRSDRSMRRHRVVSQIC